MNTNKSTDPLLGTRRKTKTIDVSASTVLDLKAELFQATEQFNRAKSASTIPGHIPAKRVLKAKTESSAKRNRGIEERQARDLAAQDDDTSVLEKSRRALERKARLYEKLRQGKVDESTSNAEYLIDFEQKRWEEEDYGLSDLWSRTETDVTEQEEDPDELVEYTDEFGRTRKIPRSQLPKQPEREGPELVSADMQREQERLRWEAEAQAQVEDGPKHYEADKEVRTMGVGFYKFSKDEAEREAQQRQLEQLRIETEQKRAVHQSIKKKHQEKLAARAEALRRKRAWRQGQVAPDEQVPVDSAAANAIHNLISSIRDSVKKTSLSEDTSSDQ